MEGREFCEELLGEDAWVDWACWEGVWEGGLGLGPAGGWVAAALLLSMPRKDVITFTRVGF